MKASLVTDSDVITLVGNPTYAEQAEYPDAWVLLRDGLEGWFSPPAPRYEFANVPHGDGVYVPFVTPLPARTVTVRFAHKGVSSVSAARARDRVAGLARQLVRLVVEDAAGVRECAGVVSTDVTAVHVSAQVTRFEVTLTCPDPLKYGREFVFVAANGEVDVVFDGTEPVFPVFEFAPAAETVSVEYGGRRLVWSGTVTGGRVTVDSRTGRPSRGILTVDEVFMLPPGSSTVEVSGATDLIVKVREAWL